MPPQSKALADRSRRRRWASRRRRRSARRSRLLIYASSSRRLGWTPQAPSPPCWSAGGGAPSRATRRVFPRFDPRAPTRDPIRAAPRVDTRNPADPRLTRHPLDLPPSSTSPSSRPPPPAPADAPADPSPRRPRPGRPRRCPDHPGRAAVSRPRTSLLPDHRGGRGGCRPPQMSLLPRRPPRTSLFPRTPSSAPPRRTAPRSRMAANTRCSSAATCASTTPLCRCRRVRVRHTASHRRSSPRRRRRPSPTAPAPPRRPVADPNLNLTAETLRRTLWPDEEPACGVRKTEVLVAGVPETIGDDAVRQVMGTYGAVSSVRRDGDATRVTMVTREGAETATAALSGVYKFEEAQPTPVIVTWCEPGPEPESADAEAVEVGAKRKREDGGEEDAKSSAARVGRQLLVVGLPQTATREDVIGYFPSESGAAVDAHVLTANRAAFVAFATSEAAEAHLASLNGTLRPPGSALPVTLRRVVVDVGSASRATRGRRGAPAGVWPPVPRPGPQYGEPSPKIYIGSIPALYDEADVRAILLHRRRRQGHQNLCGSRTVDTRGAGSSPTTTSPRRSAPFTSSTGGTCYTPPISRRKNPST